MLSILFHSLLCNIDHGNEDGAVGLACSSVQNRQIDGILRHTMSMPLSSVGNFCLCLLHLMTIVSMMMMTVPGALSDDFRFFSSLGGTFKFAGHATSPFVSCNAEKETKVVFVVLCWHQHCNYLLLCRETLSDDDDGTFLWSSRVSSQCTSFQLPKLYEFVFALFGRFTTIAVSCLCH